MTNQPTTNFQRDIYSVSRLNSEVRAVLEGSFPLLWVQGEISNLATPASGHIYFSLKDSHAQVRCAMFRMKRQYLRFQPKNGTEVLIRARISLYEGRGDFQLIAEHMEPAGEGALHQSFEELKRRLAAEGLFDTDRKKAIPTHPKQIGIITSASGAAIRDVLTVLKRRNPAIPVVIYPTSVQGDSAVQELIAAIRLANRRQECDLLILARGGGSLEDLVAFNDEQLARTIAASELPLISAIGHEVDFTIADFVADQRAPTPSAAAEIATQDTGELLHKVTTLQQRLQRQLLQQLSQKRAIINQMTKRLQQRHPGVKLEQRQQRVDELEQRLLRSLKNRLYHHQQTLQTLSVRLAAQTPDHTLKQLHGRLQRLYARLQHRMTTCINHNKQQLALASTHLNTLSPLATLERGYSITRHNQQILRNCSKVSPGDELETQLARGHITSQVIRVEAKQSKE
ncbi:MAG: exodeoxyribonuclease VII large subunit [Chromatiales bacterium]|nr:exodeoxyribonuclease VII large subunit [Chromatiales bacterium]